MFIGVIMLRVAKLIAVMLGSIMLGSVMLSVVMLSVIRASVATSSGVMPTLVPNLHYHYAHCCNYNKTSFLVQIKFITEDSK